LFQTAWKALNELLREQGFAPAAIMVLHTWNQELDHHPHVHAIVPGGGPAIDGNGWIESRHPTEKRDKPWLVDNVELGKRFRKKFIEGFRRLVAKNKLRLEDDWERLQDSVELDQWLKPLDEGDWNVFVEGPRHGNSSPSRMLMYLARYLTGGPISDSRIISDENGQVTFWARSKDKRKENAPRPYSLSGREFVRRWTLHVLPKAFVRSRNYGGFHPTKRKRYLEQCRTLLSQPAPPPKPKVEAAEPVVDCPRCKKPMTLIENSRRPSWRDVFTRRIYAPGVYCPSLHPKYYPRSPRGGEPDGFFEIPDG
jgi:Putative transposase